MLRFHIIHYARNRLTSLCLSEAQYRNHNKKTFREPNRLLVIFWRTSQTASEKCAIVKHIHKLECRVFSRVRASSKYQLQYCEVSCQFAQPPRRHKHNTHTNTRFIIILQKQIKRRANRSKPLFLDRGLV